MEITNKIEYLKILGNELLFMNFEECYDLLSRKKRRGEFASWELDDKCNKLVIKFLNDFEKLYVVYFKIEVKE